LHEKGKNIFLPFPEGESSSISANASGFVLAGEGKDKVDGVNSCLVEADFVEIHAKVLFEKDPNLDGFDRRQPAAKDEGRVIGERPLVAPSSQKCLDEIPDFVCWIHKYVPNYKY
jgi:hypothetical protein